VLKVNFFFFKNKLTVERRDVWFPEAGGGGKVPPTGYQTRWSWDETYRTNGISTNAPYAPRELRANPENLITRRRTFFLLHFESAGEDGGSLN